MLQTVATIISLLLASGAIAIITASIADDWDALSAALGVTFTDAAAFPPQVRAKSVRRTRVLQLSPRWEPLRAAA